MNITGSNINKDASINSSTNTSIGSIAGNFVIQMSSFSKTIIISNNNFERKTFDSPKMKADNFLSHTVLKRKKWVR